MRLNMFNKQLLLRLNPSRQYIRSYASALYITGDKANKHFAVLTPYVDFKKNIDNREAFVHNIKCRSLSIDFDKIIERWDFFQDIENQRKNLESTRSEIGTEISKLLKSECHNTEEVDKLKLHSKLVKDDLKNLKDMYYSIEEEVHLQILSLPNVLHKDTPSDTEVVLHKKSEKIDKVTESHLQIAKESITYINPYNCYLNSEPALFEMAILNCLRKKLLNENFIQFSSPDFSRSVVVEGCGTDFEDGNAVFTLEEPHEKFNSLSRLHLTGGAALESFMSYFTKHLVDINKFPLLYFSTGRQYQPCNQNLPFDLFNLCQESVLSVFLAYIDNQDDLIMNVQKMIVDFYDSLNYHYKIVVVPAKNLHHTESLRFSIQMYSNNLGKYVEVGNVSLYDEYFSKRLLFTSTVDKERIFPKVISGTLLNVPKFLGCAIENNNVDNKPLLSNLLKTYLFI